VNGARVLWTGRPGGGPVRLRAQDIVAVPFALAWSALVAVALVSLTLQGGWDAAAAGTLLLMALSALYLVAGRFLLDAYVRRHTAYTLTEREIIITCDAFGLRTTTLPLDRIRQIALRERRNGSGAIVFGRPSWWQEEAPVGMRAGPGVPRLDEIADVRRVYETIQSLRLAPPFAIRLEGIAARERSTAL
jgi:hypothetical protein